MGLSLEGTVLRRRLDSDYWTTLAVQALILPRSTIHNRGPDVWIFHSSTAGYNPSTMTEPARASCRPTRYSSPSPSSPPQRLLTPSLTQIRLSHLRNAVIWVLQPQHPSSSSPVHVICNDYTPFPFHALCRFLVLLTLELAPASPARALSPPPSPPLRLTPPLPALNSPVVAGVFWLLGR
ncbi:hypothetical protein R3P38DRAFT_3193205 [Favolaschia claudopus]|uniref:Uncharacterized protein n=1 Tax=Favolaschia claudopus TaxID=2862362 RepID=A0AAW0BHG9_9AGAR